MPDKMAHGPAHEQLRIDRLHECGRSPIDGPERLLACRSPSAGKRVDSISRAAALGDGAQVEHVAWLEIPATVIDLLCNNFGGGFELDGYTAHVAGLRGWVENVCAADEVDLADILKCKLQHGGAISALAVRHTRHIDALRLRVQIRQDLGIIEEEIDIMAFAVIDLQH